MPASPSRLPVVAITLGDPAGVGPEVALKGAIEAGVRAECRPILVGAASVVERTLSTWDPAKRPDVVAIKDASEIDGINSNAVVVLDTHNIDDAEWEIGKLSKAGGTAAAEDTETAVRIALEGKVDAIVSGPVNKQGLQLAGRDYPGQTEFIQALSRGPKPLKILVGGKLRVAQMTSHMSLAAAVGKVTKENVLDIAIRFSDALKNAWGIEKPRIAVSALNPHAGDNGLLGKEEIDEIEPAIREAVGRGYDIVGPVPADVSFMQGEEGRYDGVVSLYHDQGTIPLKRLKFASVAYGLPVIRTTPGHGTAYDIAGKGTADATAMISALQLAARLARQRLDKGA
ncbi:4-hydroxythreonine-4-phosphate dehydrogenase PdxA [Ancylobacter sp. MQZ15Z-1]|uniref:4-hydroxythreonine-4-phosphate dehydrogenase PdxA n=1 Tax=Ancylobacter mangrovi TaxID=2972472 RepID=A0A9X2T678_9HYPH|nr:4-hydroxythreonine-4-phosphate dehydrogenase PdxA [Ancylobacter mangrovi]MCS0494633.1 4-hydroxythreonine-4-phosphate dehydrogenase PdxA [Ancylobacter mangrovi]